MAAPRIVLVDDHALCRNGLSDLLRLRGGMEVLAALSDPDEVIRLLREHKPDLVVLDQDLFAIPPDRIKDEKVVITIVGGRVVFERSRM